LIAFTILAYAISWLGWMLSFGIDLGAANGFGIIGSAGPALAAMIVSAMVRPEPSGVPAGKRWRSFGAIGVLTLAVITARRLWITPAWLAVAGDGTTTVPFPSFVAVLMDVVAAAVVAFVLSGVLSPRQGVRDLLRSLDLRRRPVRWHWWAIALGLYPAVLALGYAVSTAFGLEELAPRPAGLWTWLAPDVLLTSLYFLIGGGGLEEPGWRGFFLTGLQRRFGPLPASLILAVVWALWHLPFFSFGGAQGGLLGMVLYLLLEIAPVAVLFTALFNRTRGSLPIAMLLHVSVNVTPVFLPASTLGNGLWLLIMIGLAIWMWRAPRAFSASEVGFGSAGG
jgi:membrane protease YdiL (CAAX protease family)